MNFNQERTLTKPGSICSLSSSNTRSIEIGQLRTSPKLRVYTA
jgi:hypothetical protein